MQSFTKHHQFLLCVDSDGCAMDTMTYKHEKAFCPKLIEVYALNSHAQLITEYWHNVNLYSATRGVNRFKGLAMTLQMLSDKGIPTQGVEELLDFVHTSNTLSNAALENAIKKGGGIGLSLALQWSRKVNEEIESLAHCAKPFEGCLQALKALHQQMHIAVVSSANSAAVEQEWLEHGIATYTDVRYGQEAGSKAACIAELLKLGFEKDKVLMVGDALGDLQAAQQNDVLFYPIIPSEEAKSWHTLQHVVAPSFLAQTYKRDLQATYMQKQAQILK